MKLAFSTLGCPDWDLPTIVRRAQEYGFQGVDFRGYLGEMRIDRRPEFSGDVGRTAALFREAGLDVPCLSSSITLLPRSARRSQENREELSAYLGLCETFGARYLRVFGGSAGTMERAEALTAAVKSLRELLPEAEGRGVTLLLETHDDWVHAEHIRALMEAAGSEALGVLWDIHHPYRHGEPPETTWSELGRWIRYTHWKDAVGPGEGRLCRVGEGDLPLRDFLSALRRGGYDGYLTLEWELKWHPELDPPEVAFPAYVRRMRALLGEAG